MKQPKGRFVMEGSPIVVSQAHKPATEEVYIHVVGKSMHVCTPWLSCYGADTLCRK